MSQENAELRRELEHLKGVLHEEHGHRIALTQQYVRSGEMREAVRCRGEAISLWKLISVLENRLATGTFREYEPTEYGDLSKAMMAAHRAAGDQQEQPSEPDPRGLQ